MQLFCCTYNAALFAQLLYCQRAGCEMPRANAVLGAISVSNSLRHNASLPQSAFPQTGYAKLPRLLCTRKNIMNVIPAVLFILVVLGS